MTVNQVNTPEKSSTVNKVNTPKGSSTKKPSSAEKKKVWRHKIKLIIIDNTKLGWWF